MKIAIVISALIIIGVVGFLAARPSSKQRELDEIYAELKSMPPVARDFVTPEGAILCLGDAYYRRDIDAAIAAKDFKTEAKPVLQKTGIKKQIDNEMVTGGWRVLNPIK